MRWKLTAVTLAAALVFVAGAACAGPGPRPVGAPDEATPQAKPPKDGKLQITLTLEKPDAGLAGAIIYVMAEGAELKCRAIRGPVTSCTHRVWADIIDLETMAGEFTLTYTPGGHTLDIFIPLGDPAIEGALVRRSVESPASILRIVVLDLKGIWERRGEATVGKMILIGRPGAHTVDILIPVADDDNGDHVVYRTAEMIVTIPGRVGE